MRVLVVDDEKKMASFIERGLREEGYAVDVAHDGEQGLEYALNNEYDMMVLDWMMPKISGVALCGKIREKGIRTPVLLLTVRDSVEDKIKGLDEGADDYLTKPFVFHELLARIRALLRRPVNIQNESVLKIGQLQVDLIARRVKVVEDEITFSQKEFALLEYLIRHQSEVVSRSQIAEHVWDLHFDPMSNTIDVYINFLRKKIDSQKAECKIETVRGVGYRIVKL